MRKILSVVLAVLMVSMIIPTMSFAAADVVIKDCVGNDYSSEYGLVAGEEFTITLSADAVLAVNTQVFDIIDDAATTAGKVESVSATANTAVKVKVQTSIPKEFTSDIKVGEDKVTLQIRNRVIGDVNGFDGVTTYDAAQLLAYSVGASYDAGFKPLVADINGLEGVTTYDAAQLLAYSVGAATDAEVQKLVNTYAAGIDDTIVVEDPFAAPTTVELAAPTGLYAYHQNGTVYFTFDSVKGATGYTVQVGDGEEQTFTDTSGSVTATYPEEGTLEITVVAKGDGTTTIDSEAATTNVVDATVSEELARWLSQNGLNDVAITVYEITE